MAKKEKPAELEINNVKELDAKLAEAIKNNENKPTEEEVAEAQKKFEESSRNFSVKSWDIGENEQAHEFLDYLQHYVRNRIFWTQNGWMGVVKITEELDDAEKFLKTNPKSTLKLGYQAMEFMFYSLQNPGGVGLQTALDFEQENEIYAKVFDSIGKQVASARTELKDIQFFQDQYAAMAQGFYLEIEPGIEELEREDLPDQPPAEVKIEE